MKEEVTPKAGMVEPGLVRGVAVGLTEPLMVACHHRHGSMLFFTCALSAILAASTEDRCCQWLALVLDGLSFLGFI